MSGLLQKNIDLAGSHIPWLEGLRDKGREAFILPTAKTEAWKYTKLRDLTADDFVLSGTDEDESHGEEHCTCGQGECHCHHHHEPQTNLPFAGYEIHFENGILQTLAFDLPKGVMIKPLMEAVCDGDDVKKYLGKDIDLASYPFAALNTAYLEEGVYIEIEEGVILSKPIILINHTHSCHQNIMAYLRNVIVLENDAKATIIEDFEYTGEEKSRYFNNIVNEIYINKQAKLEHYKLQNEAYKAVHISLSSVRVREGGFYESFCCQKGANLARNETKISLKEEHAEAVVNAVYLMNGWATIDTTTDIEHLSPNTKSQQLVKGVVGGNAKGVFQGKIHIAPNAVKTEGHQLHKALLLSDDAEIDCKPELEIYADDVKCSHGAASGELDKEQLFYMRSRGIGEEEAKRILVEAYLNDVINQISQEDIKTWMLSQATINQEEK